VADGPQARGVGGASERYQVRGPLRGRDLDGDGEQAGGLEQSVDGLQEVSGVGGRSGPVQQDEVGAAGVACDGAGMGVPGQGVVASPDCCGHVGQGGVVVEVDDEVTGLGVVVEQAPGEVGRQAAWLVRGGVCQMVRRAMAGGLVWSDVGWTGVAAGRGPWPAGSAPAAGGHAST
jgi:hypothetical protein